MQRVRRFGRAGATFALVVGLTATAAAAGAAGGPSEGEAPEWSKARVGGTVTAPMTPNPFLANLPGGVGDYRSWTAYAAHQSVERRAAPVRGPRSDAVRERPGNNDMLRGAQPVFVNTGSDGAGGIDIIGRGPSQASDVTTNAGFAQELNGSIPDAQVLPILSVGDQVFGSGVIGDEIGDSFDFDFFALPGLAAGDTIVIDIDTPIPFGDLDPFVALWSDDGPPFPIVDANDDDGQTFDSRLQVTIPADGTYFVSVGGFGAFVPADPFDAASPSDTGEVGSQGEYSYTISSILLDVDHYSIRLAKGDIFGATVYDGSSLELYGPRGELLIGSSQDLTFIHPDASPLPGGGDASLSYVIDQAGKYTLAVGTSEDYVAELRAFRPAGDIPGRGTQQLFLDFDGGDVDTAIFGAPFGVASLSPLADFLPRWGLDASDEDAVIDAIVDVVVENLESDIDAFGGNSDFGIEILNSRDHPEPTGPLASRIVVGGTIDEFGIPTVGIAQSIDVGNFETSETAVVLLDLLSAPPGAPDFIPGLSLNTYEIAPGATVIDLIGVGVGNITAHEAGHFFANWHTDQFNPQANIMDQGGNPVGIFGVGPDLVFGSDDDVDVDFGEDVFVPNEGFRGLEDTLTSIAYGLWSTGG